MVVEISADTYDWEKLHERGKEFVYVLNALAVDDSVDAPDEFADRAADHLHGHTDVDTRVLSDQEADTFIVEAPAGDEAWRTYSVTIRIEAGHLPTAEFTVSPDFTDDRVLYDGPLTTEEFDADWARDCLTHLFETCRKAICEVSEETYLSDRQAEAFLAIQRWGDERAAELMGVSTSNLTTYETRIRECLPEAKTKRDKAERTIDLLEGTWADEE